LRFGISFGAFYADPHEYLKCVVEAERLGYDYAFLPDSQMIYRDPFPILGAASIQTERITLGIMVSSVVTRHTSVLASAFHTVYELSRGRSVFILGRGDSSVRRIGLKPVKIDEFVHKVNEIKQYLRGVKSSSGFHIRYVTHDVPVLVMATGEKMLRIAGWLGDGAAILLGPALASYAYSQIQIGAKEANVDTSKRRYIFTAFCSISDDRKEAIANVKPAVTWFFINSPHIVKVLNNVLNISLPNDFWSNIERFRRDYARHDYIHEQRWDEAVKECAFIPDEIASALALAGTPEDVVQTLKSLKTFFNEVVIRPVSTDEWYTVFKKFGKEVIPRLKHL
jgi:5,10-methylenetetrahydromethanopterin reductase